jgi:hypothetical protein
LLPLCHFAALPRRSSISTQKSSHASSIVKANDETETTSSTTDFNHKFFEYANFAPSGVGAPLESWSSPRTSSSRTSERLARHCRARRVTLCLADTAHHVRMHARAHTAPARAHVARCVTRQRAHRTASGSRRAAFASVVVVVARAAPRDAAPEPEPEPAFDASQSMHTNPSNACPVCHGTGWKPCGQCEGAGVNATDLFGGRYRAGDACWLCAGKAKTMCGNCVDLTDTF